MMRVIIAGSRGFKAVPAMWSKTDAIFSESWPDEIVSGGARGADQFGEQWARVNNVPVKLFPAQWDVYGKSAGYRRNVDMADYATHLLAFWDQQSRGTRHMIEIARARDLPVRIVTIGRG